MGEFIQVSDLTPFVPNIDGVKATAMIEDVEAQALLLAPCIGDDDFAATAGLKAILRGAILRWNDTGSGAAQQQSAGPFSMMVDTRQERRGMFWPSEITQLQSLCGVATTGAYTLSMAGPPVADVDDGFS
jgi:hypothetical protein